MIKLTNYANMSRIAVILNNNIALIWLTGRCWGHQRRRKWNGLSSIWIVSNYIPPPRRLHVKGYVCIYTYIYARPVTVRIFHGSINRQNWSPAVCKLFIFFIYCTLLTCFWPSICHSIWYGCVCTCLCVFLFFQRLKNKCQKDTNATKGTISN